MAGDIGTGKGHVRLGITSFEVPLSFLEVTLPEKPIQINGVPYSVTVNEDSIRKALDGFNGRTYKPSALTILTVPSPDETYARDNEGTKQPTFGDANTKPVIIVQRSEDDISEPEDLEPGSNKLAIVVYLPANMTTEQSGGAAQAIINDAQNQLALGIAKFERANAAYRSRLIRLAGVMGVSAAAGSILTAANTEGIGGDIAIPAGAIVSSVMGGAGYIALWATINNLKGRPAEPPQKFVDWSKPDKRKMELLIEHFIDNPPVGLVPID